MEKPTAVYRDETVFARSLVCITSHKQFLDGGRKPPGAAEEAAERESGFDTHLAVPFPFPLS